MKVTSKYDDTAVVIGLIDPKSPTNVGAVLRAAGCYQAGAVCYTGLRYDKAAKFHTDTKNVSSRIPLIAVEDFSGFKREGRKLVCVDLVEGATALPLFEHPQKAIYVFGPEDGSVNQALVDQADEVVYVPTIGCMNLAASVNVLLYDRLAKASVQAFLIQSEELDDSSLLGDALIRKSRDTNNKVKVMK